MGRATWRGRSRGEKVLNVESEQKKVSSSFLPEEGFGGRLCTEASECRCSADVQRARSPLSGSLPGLPCPAVPGSEVGRLAFPCEESWVKPLLSPVTGPEGAHVGSGPEAGLLTTILFQADLTPF